MGWFVRVCVCDISFDKMADISLKEAEWRTHTAAAIVTKPEVAERVIHEAVWRHINALPQNERDDILKAATQGTVNKHPIFAQIFQRVHTELHQQTIPNPFHN